MKDEPTASPQEDPRPLGSRREFIKQATAITAVAASTATNLYGQSKKHQVVLAGGAVEVEPPPPSWSPPVDPPTVPNARVLAKVGRCPIVVGDMPYPNELIPHHLGTLGSKYDFFGTTPMAQVPEEELLNLEGDLAKAYGKMRSIFNWILSETYRRLMALNAGIVAANSGAGPSKYEQARASYDTFLNSKAGYDAALDWISVKPRFDAAKDGTQGLISGCSVSVHWKNPYHSSSTIKIP